MARVPVQALTRESFRPYGDVVEVGERFTIERRGAFAGRDFAGMEFAFQNSAD